MLRIVKNVWKKTTLAGVLVFFACVASADIVDDLIDDAYHNYPSIKSKQMAQNSADKEILAAKLNFLPTLSVSAQPFTKNYGYYNGASAGPYTVITVKQPLIGGGLY